MIRMSLLNYPFVICAVLALVLFVSAYLAVLVFTLVKESREVQQQGALLPLLEE